MAHRVVLDPDLATAQLVGEVSRANHRREADVVADRDVAVDRQQVLVPPHAGRTGGDRLTGDDPLQCFVAVIDLEGTQTELPGGNGSRPVAATTLAALQASQLLHA